MHSSFVSLKEHARTTLTWLHSHGVLSNKEFLEFVDQLEDIHTREQFQVWSNSVWTLLDKNWDRL